MNALDRYQSSDKHQHLEAPAETSATASALVLVHQKSLDVSSCRVPVSTAAYSTYQVPHPTYISSPSAFWCEILLGEVCVTPETQVQRRRSRRGGHHPRHRLSLQHVTLSHQVTLRSLALN
uniref:Uncharacterized protein n=1 Tax=Molossus molossus TaxID=27622 RepID=A0A7J8JVT4_MOLMO|nr:hypothetical protein HJG59_007958 [Molossus molossus]